MQLVQGEEKYIQGLSGGTLKESDHMDCLGIYGREMLKWILNKWNGRA
jgi:hypothetical protein